MNWVDMTELALLPKGCKPDLAAVQPKASLSTVDKMLNEGLQQVLGRIVWHFDRNNSEVVVYLAMAAKVL